ncbi:hypothetical protein ALO_12326 [Acetonema longum DSM 6540]|uniref:Uncharacterized protein n=1 Tax=Acetonema longum DSM 6540 TaxID=1009370 RepID=F7NK52_9FIRM|nr:hypothetical protein ALO_12326 [Acetonema longum DSM 6540]
MASATTSASTTASPLSCIVWSNGYRTENHRSSTTFNDC